MSATSEGRELHSGGELKVLHAIEELKLSLLKELKGQDPFWWKVSQVVLPVLLTAALGGIAWYFQVRVQSDFDKQLTVARTQLGYTQYLYERRLDAYRETYDKVLATFDSLQDILPDDPQASAAKDRLHRNLQMISDLANKNRLIASDELNDLLEEAWRGAIKNGSDFNPEELKNKVAQRMRKDLLMDAVKLEAPKP